MINKSSRFIAPRWTDDSTGGASGGAWGVHPLSVREICYLLRADRPLQLSLLAMAAGLWNVWLASPQPAVSSFWWWYCTAVQMVSISLMIHTGHKSGRAIQQWKEGCVAMSIAVKGQITKCEALGTKLESCLAEWHALSPNSTRFLGAQLAASDAAAHLRMARDELIRQTEAYERHVGNCPKYPYDPA